MTELAFAHDPACTVGSYRMGPLCTFINKFSLERWFPHTALRVQGHMTRRLHRGLPSLQNPPQKMSWIAAAFCEGSGFSNPCVTISRRHRLATRRVQPQSSVVVLRLFLFLSCRSLAGPGAVDELQVGGALEEAGVAVPLHQAVNLGLGHVEAPGGGLLHVLQGLGFGYVVKVHLGEERGKNI